MINQVPSFRAKYKIEQVDAESVFFISEKERFLLRGKNNLAVTALINGENSIETILHQLINKVDSREILRILQSMVVKGHVTFDQSRHDTAFHQELSITRRHIADFTIAVTATDRRDADDFALLAKKEGFSLSDNPKLSIVIVNDYLSEDPDVFPVKTTTPLIIIHPTGFFPSFSPVLNNGTGPCPECLHYWLSINKPVEQSLARLKNRPSGFIFPDTGTDLGKRIIYNAAIIELIKYTADGNSATAHLVRFNLMENVLERHYVVKRPQCPLCGDPQLMTRQASTPVTIASVVSRFTDDGGYRTVVPIDTYEKYKHLVSPVSGAVNYLHPMPGRDKPGRYVFVSGYMVSPKHNIPQSNVFDKICAGKGKTPHQARTSALCEALERFCGIYRGDEAIIRSSGKKLGDKAISFDVLQNFSEKQYRNRMQTNACTSDHRKWVPEPFDDSAVIDWTPAWSLLTNKMYYVPLAYCFSETSDRKGMEFGIHNPNGSAAGNCMEEAILQGFLELVERDSVAIWWYNMLRRPAFDIVGFNDRFLNEAVTAYDEMGWDLWLLDITTDLMIPSCTALARHRSNERFAIGFGSHLNANLALQRAVTEVNQLLDVKSVRPAPWDHENIPDTRFLHPCTDKKSNAIDFPEIACSDLKDILDTCLTTVKKIPSDFLVVNKTRPDIGLNVVQVIVPGLRHFWPRFGPGRLYDVPFNLGWVDRKRSENDINPVSIFL